MKQLSLTIKNSEMLVVKGRYKIKEIDIIKKAFAYTWIHWLEWIWVFSNLCLACKLVCIRLVFYITIGISNIVL